MSLTVGMYHFDCRNPVPLADFWSAILDLPVDAGATGELAMIDFEKRVGPTWIFQRCHDLGAGRNRFAVDLSSADWQERADRVESLGGTRLGDHEVGGVRWIELLDVESNLFRVFAPRRAVSAGGRGLTGPVTAEAVASGP